MILLSILIPTIKRHDEFFTRLFLELSRQIIPYEGQVEILVDDHETDSTGTKRNRLLERAKGEWLSYIDADDWISNNYVSLLMEAIETDCDCVSLKGMYSVDGKQDGIFEHSLRYKEWKTTTNEVKYERYPTPLNTVRSSVAKQFKFPEITFGEDHAWSKLVHESGLLKKEYYIPEIIYYYNYQSKK